MVKKTPESKGMIGIIGAGNFTKMTLLPSLEGANLKYIASAAGVNGNALAKKFKIPLSTTDYRQILNDPETDLVMITTRHHLHAGMALEALNSGKHVFVEKPLALYDKELDDIERHFLEHPDAPTLTVGFNRRFSPFITRMKTHAGNGPVSVVITVNAGYVSPESWLHNRSVGGGRLIGEACHFIDLMVFLSGSLVSALHVTPLGVNPSETTDSAHIALQMANGSTAVINYLSNGSKAYPKERIEVYVQGKTLVLDNFRVLRGYGTPGFSSYKATRDKGHKAQFQHLLSSLKKGEKPIIPLHEILNVSRATLAISKSISTREWINIR